MFKRVLVPTDFSDSAKRVLDYVLGFKNLGLEEVIMVHVLDTSGLEYPVIKELEREAAHKLDEEGKNLRKQGFKVECITLIGIPHEEILRAAVAENVSLIVTGSHGKSPLDEILVGSTSEMIGRESKIPVLLIRYGILEEKSKASIKRFAKRTFEKILHPTDFSDCSRRALERIKMLEDMGIKEVIIAHVIDDRHLRTAGERDRLKCEKSKLLPEVERELAGKGFKVKTRLAFGWPVAELVRIAGEEGVTSIVMGSHGKGIVGETFLGSISQNVVRMANKPVLIIH